MGSVFGNSQLIKLHAPNAPVAAATFTATAITQSTDSVVEVLEVYPNIGPIVDMCVVQAERKGQNRVVTCSGAFKDGSLRVISSGVGIQEQVGNVYFYCCFVVFCSCCLFVLLVRVPILNCLCLIC